MYILKLDSLKGFADTKLLVDVFTCKMPSHSYIELSGFEGHQFLNNFYAAPISNTLPVSVNPFMVEYSMEINNNYYPETLNAFTWDYYSDRKENLYFKSVYKKF